MIGHLCQIARLFADRAAARRNPRQAESRERRKFDEKGKRFSFAYMSTFNFPSFVPPSSFLGLELFGRSRFAENVPRARSEIWMRAGEKSAVRLRLNRKGALLIGESITGS